MPRRANSALTVIIMMSKDIRTLQQLLPYEAPTLWSLQLVPSPSILVNFSLELDFEDFEEEDEF